MLSCRSLWSSQIRTPDRVAAAHADLVAGLEGFVEEGLQFPQLGRAVALKAALHAVGVPDEDLVPARHLISQHAITSCLYASTNR